MTLITALNTVATSGKSIMPTGLFNEYRVEKTTTKDEHVVLKITN